MFRINNIKISENLTDDAVFNKIIKKYKIDSSDIISWKISKKSIDARKKNNIHFVYSIDFDLKNEKKYKNLVKVDEIPLPNINVNIIFDSAPVIIGAGPARFVCCSYINKKWY